MKKIITFTTTQNIRIDEFLRNRLPEAIKNEGENSEGFSNSKIRRLILSGSVQINGKTIIRPAFELRGKSTVSINYDAEKFFYEKQPDDIKFEVTEKSVLYEDENLIFINKPSFFPVEQTITGNRNNLHDCVVNYLWKKNPKLHNPPYVGIMHRLDKDTSGVILFTKNRNANKPVFSMFENHNFTKEYLAVCSPNTKMNPESEQIYKPGKKFTVEKFMGRISGKSQAGRWGTLPESKGGQYSKTDFEILKEVNIEGKNCLLIKCQLFTGRTHQIRVHLSEEGIPILGDSIYDGQKASRLYLHASRLAFNNELGNLEISAPVPWK